MATMKVYDRSKHDFVDCEIEDITDIDSHTTYYLVTYHARNADENTCTFVVIEFDDGSRLVQSDWQERAYSPDKVEEIIYSCYADERFSPELVEGDIKPVYEVWYGTDNEMASKLVEEFDDLEEARDFYNGYEIREIWLKRYTTASYKRSVVDEFKELCIFDWRYDGEDWVPWEYREIIERESYGLEDYDKER